MAEISKITLPNGSVYDLKASKDGDGNIITSTYIKKNVDTIPESSLVWGNKAFTADYSMGDIFLNDYLRANRFAGVKASAITVEYSSDGGSTWNDYQTNDLLKRNLFTTSSGYHIGGSSSGTVTANSQLRITLDFTEGSIYTNLRKIMIYVSTNYSQNCKVTITASKGTSPNDYSLIVCENQSIAGWSGWNIIPCNFITYGNTDGANSQYQRIRFVFTNSGLSDTSRKGGLQICRIYGYGGVGWSTPSNLALTGHVYTYDGNLHVNFPANVTAAQFNGGLNGNATSASKLNSTRSFTIGKTAKNVDWSGAVSFSQAEISDNASTSVAGWMSKDDKIKLNGIETGAQVNTITGVKGDSESSYRTGNVNITATNIGLGNLTNNKQVKGLSSGTTNNNLVAWGSDGYTVADSGIAKGSVATKLALSGTNYSASSNTITVTKANLQSAVQDSDLVLMTAAERTKLASIDTGGNYVTIGNPQTITGEKTFSAIASFTNSVKIGQSLSATGTGSLAQGYSTTSSGKYSTAFGSSTTSSGKDSHAQGAFSIASGEASHAEGNHTEASGYISHAEGNHTIASNPGAHAEGSQTLASGTYSHAEGLQTSALESYSHAQGLGSVALRQGAHAEGWMSIASGEYSHAEGQRTKAIGNNSHTSGEETYATRNNQFVIGEYNRITESATNPPICSNALFCGNDVIVDGQDYIVDSGNHAFIIGNGTASNRSNALAIDWNGGIYINNPDLSVNDLQYSSSRNPFALFLGDKDGNRMGGIAYHVNPEDNEIGTLLQGYRKVNNTNYYNDLRLMLDSSGANVVRVSSPSAWRMALQLNNITDMIRVVEFKKTNVSIGANNSVSPVTITATAPTGFSFVSIVGWRIDTVDTTSGANSVSCVVTNYWGTTTLNATVRNFASSAAKVTVNLKVLYKRTTL